MEPIREESVGILIARLHETGTTPHARAQALQLLAEWRSNLPDLPQEQLVALKCSDFVTPEVGK